MKTKRLLQRAFALLFVFWIFDFVSLTLLMIQMGGQLVGYLSVGVIQGFLVMIILGLLVTEVTKKE